MTTPKTLLVDGVAAWTVAPYGDLGWETTSQGMHEITWAMDVTDDLRSQHLRVGKLVEVMDGPVRIGAGTIHEPNLETGEFIARGLYRSAEDFPALDIGTGVTTSVPNKAIDWALANGIPWTGRIGISGVAFTDSETTSGVNYLATLLDAFADRNGIRWFVTPDGIATIAALETVPTWHLAPGLTYLGATEDGIATDLVGRYRTSSGFATVTVSDPVARATYGRHFEPVDLTSYGVMSATTATNTLTGLLAKGAAKAGFTDALEVTADQLTTAGGVSADLSMVQAGQMVRSHGVLDDTGILGGETFLDWIIGNTKWGDGAETITLQPLGMAPQDFAAIIAAQGTRRAFQA